MTAFSNAEASYDDLSFSWELRSVNHRYLDVSIYLPEGLVNQEHALKEIVRKKLGRGKFDAKLVCNKVGDLQHGGIKINSAVVKDLLNTHKELSKLAGQELPLSTVDILQFPDALESSQIDYSIYTKKVTSLFKEALSLFVKSREEEGKRLAEMLLVRAHSVTEIVKQVRLRRPQVIAALREKMFKRLSEIDLEAAAEANNNRLEQELVFQAQRLDVDEELDRLDSHIEELISVLKRKEPVGRRLDFLMQELNREANTLGSKANDAETTKATVELKVLIEQMREQVMNIE